MKILQKTSQFLLILIVLVFPISSATAQAALTVTGVTPSNVLNHTANTLSINGSDFVDGAVVKVNGTNLATTFVDDSTLSALLPAGFPAGTHSVTVINPDSNPGGAGKRA